MMVYETMKTHMAPLKIYDDDAQVLEYELRTYASEIERLYSWLDTMFHERFIETAEDIGLTVYEELFGPERDDESVENRRAMLKLRMNLGEGDFTPSGIQKALDSLGLSYTISEFPTLNRLNITATTDYSEAQQALILREVTGIVPAHLDFQMTFNTITWDELDALDRPFDAIDTEDQTWDQFDHRTE